MQDDVKAELQSLRNDMAQFQLAPSEAIVADNNPHMYTVNIKGEPRQAIYTATTYPLEEDQTGPSLICWYGFPEDEPHFYSSLMTK